MKSVLLIVGMCASGIAAASDVANVLPAEAVEALHSNGPAAIYSLEPLARTDAQLERLEGYAVLGKSDLDDAQRPIAVGAFDAAVAGWDGRVAGCFEPRHALRIRFRAHVYDFLLCYACQQIEVLRDGKHLGGAGVAGSSRVLDDLMTRLHLPLSHSLEGIMQQQEVRRMRTEAGEKRFLAAMPPSLQPFWTTDADVQWGLGIDAARLDAMRAAFVSANPDPDAAIRALLVWFGSGLGPWSGFPGYETVAERLLLGYPTARIVATAQAPDASDALLEGAARYLAGWEFDRQHRPDASLIPALLKQRLLEHTLRTGDPDDKDRRGRAQEAFGDDEQGRGH